MGDERRHRLTPDERAYIATTGPVQRTQEQENPMEWLERMRGKLNEAQRQRGYLLLVDRLMGVR